MNYFKTLFSVGLWVLLPLTIYAQGDLLSELEDDAATEAVSDITTATFKSTRIINTQSVELIPGNHLDFRISHRFGQINSGAYNLWGLDQATIRLGLEYGLWDRVNIGVGRSSFQKVYDGYFKLKFLKQQTGIRTTPVSLVWFSNMSLTTLKTNNQYARDHLYTRLAYAHQLLIARKFSQGLSLQIAPVLAHYNYVETNRENNLYAIALGGRAKVSKRISVNLDYVYRIDPIRDNGYYNSLSLGVDIETGGHVFQLHATNSQGMIEEYFIGQTTGRWQDGDIYFGFNISRQFSLAGKRKSRN